MNDITTTVVVLEFPSCLRIEGNDLYKMPTNSYKYDLCF
jgi:hypothetical protein